MARPIIKWVGGKRQLLEELLENLPKKYNRYFEPFIGGGALFFEIEPKGGVINDFNEELINVYQMVKNHPYELIEDLKKHKNERDYYYQIRALDRSPEFHKLSNIQKASRFIYLNKTAYNGLYRVNKKGQFNVPFGRYKNPCIVDEEAILQASKLLQKTTILCGDFENIKELVKPGDFVYLDPPYVPLSATSSFTAYTHQGFDEKMQHRLKQFCDYLDSIGAYFMLSNSYTKFVLDLYKEYTILTVQANRALNCKADGRGKINEVMVKNYKE